MNDPQEILRAVGGRALAWAFNMLDVCAEETRGRDVSSELWNALAPPPAMSGMIKEVYVSHVRELLARAEAKEDLSQPTKAELLAFISLCSLKAPLKDSVASLYARVMREVIGDVTCACGESGCGMLSVREAYPGELDEMEFEFKRAIATLRGRGKGRAR